MSSPKPETLPELRNSHVDELETESAGLLPQTNDHFFDKSAYQSVKQEPEDRRYTCKLCGLKFQFPYQLGGHVVALHSRKHKVRKGVSKPRLGNAGGVALTSRRPSVKAQLPELRNSHLDELETESAGLLPQTNDYFFDKSAYQSVKQEPEDRRYTCKLCGLKFQFPYQLGGHVVALHSSKHKVRKGVSKPRLGSAGGVVLTSCRGVKAQLRYKCKMCGLGFASCQQLGGHVRHKHKTSQCKFLKTANSNKLATKLPIKCKECGLVLKTLLSAEAHLHKRKEVYSRVKRTDAKSLADNSILTAHEPSIKAHLCHRCNICSQEFAFGHQLGGHITAHKHHSVKTSTNIPVYCEVCGAEFKNLLSLGIHSKTHKGNKNRQNRQKSLAHTSGSLLSAHQSRSANPALNCKVCRSQFASDVSLREVKCIHKSQSKTTTSSRTDKKCIKRTKVAANLDVKNADNIKCPECLVWLKNRNAFYMHSLNHLAIRRFVCKECGIHFLRQEHLDRHAKAHVNKLPLSCNQCCASYNYERSLLKHKRMHEHPDGTLVRCDKCNFVFPNGKILKRHIEMRHTAKKRFECDVCQGQFNESNLLARHLKLHAKEQNLTRLQRNNENAYLNASLLKSVSTASKRNSVPASSSIKALSSGSTPMSVCEMCNRTFQYSKSLRRHVAKYHQKVYCSVCKKFVDEQHVSRIPGLRCTNICVSCATDQLKDAPVVQESTHRLPTVSLNFTYLVNKLLRQLVDEEVLKSECLLEKPVHQQLSAVVGLCGERPAENKNGSVEECMCENVKRLFYLSVGEEATSILFRFKSVEEILSIMLNLNDISLK